MNIFKQRRREEARLSEVQVSLGLRAESGEHKVNLVFSDRRLGSMELDGRSLEKKERDLFDYCVYVNSIKYILFEILSWLGNRAEGAEARS